MVSPRRGGIFAGTSAFAMQHRATAAVAASSGKTPTAKGAVEEAVTAEHSFLRHVVPFHVQGSGPASTLLRHSFLQQGRLITRVFRALEEVPLPSLPRMLLAEGLQQLLDGDVPQRRLRELFEEAEVECRKMLLQLDYDASGSPVYSGGGRDQWQAEEAARWTAVQKDPLSRVLAYELRAACGYYAQLMSVSSAPFQPAAMLVRTLLSSDVRTDDYLVKLFLNFEQHPRNTDTGERLEQLPTAVAEMVKEMLLLERDVFGTYRFDARGDNRQLVHCLKLSDITKTPRDFAVLMDPVMQQYGNYRVEKTVVHGGRWMEYRVTCGAEDHRIDPGLPVLETVGTKDEITGRDMSMIVLYDEAICQRHKTSSKEERGNYGHTEVFELAIEKKNRTFLEAFFLDR